MPVNVSNSLLDGLHNQQMGRQREVLVMKVNNVGSTVTRSDLLDVESSLKNPSGELSQVPASGRAGDNLGTAAVNGVNIKPGSRPTQSLWDLINAVDLPKQSLNIRRSTGSQVRQLENLLGMQNKLYQGGLVVELVSKTTDAMIHGVKRLQNSS